MLRKPLVPQDAGSEAFKALRERSSICKAKALHASGNDPALMQDPITEKLVGNLMDTLMLFGLSNPHLLIALINQRLHATISVTQQVTGHAQGHHLHLQYRPLGHWTTVVNTLVDNAFCWIGLKA